MRTCAGAVLGVYLEHYFSISFELPNMMELITEEVVVSVHSVFHFVLSEDTVNSEVRQIVAQLEKEAEKRIKAKQAAVSPIVPIPASGIKERMERVARKIGIKDFCSKADISPASYHKIRDGSAGEKVRSKVESFLALYASSSDPEKSIKL